MRDGTSIVVVGVTTECSNAEPEPFFGATARERRECARANNDLIEVSEVIVDEHAFDIQAFRFTTRDTRVKLPEGNLLGTDRRHARFTADGWIAVIRPLTPGTHTIVSHAAGRFPDTEPFDVSGQMTLHVVPDDHGEND